MVLTAAMLAPAARTIALTHRRAAYTPLGVAQAFLVASTYDVARALALVLRKSHRRA
jgi:hypothetical protein